MKTTFTMPVAGNMTNCFSTMFVNDGFRNFRHSALLILVSFFNTLFIVQESKANFTVQAGTIVRADTLIAYGGVLTINGTLNLTRNTVLAGFTSVVINAPNGQIYWTNNSDLTFAAGTSIVIKELAPGLRPGGGNSSQRLWVGSTLMAVANNNSGPAAMTFSDMNIAGGLPEFALAVSAISVCYGTVLTATLMPQNTGISYDCNWSADNAGIISPAAASNFNTARVVTIIPVNSATSKVYTISCKVFKAGDNDPITTKSISVTVNPSPAVPSAVSATPTAVCQGSASNLSATAPGNVIEWYSTAVGGTPIGTSASTAAYSYSAASNTKFYAGSLISATGCRSASRIATPTVTVSPVTAGGTVNGSANVCTGMNNTLLTISDHTGSVTRWESSTDNFASINPISSNSTALATTNLVATTYYRAIVTSGVCAPATSAVAVLTVTDAGKWEGVNTDWNNALNWCNATIPAPNADIIIASGLLYYPEITGVVSVNSLVIATGATVKVKGNGILKIAGSINSHDGINAEEGMVELNGTTTQIISAENFTTAKIAHLRISNTTPGATAARPSVALNASGGMLKISEVISFGDVDNALLQTNDQLTLLSAAAGTARVADLTNNNVNANNTVAGKVVVERFIAAHRAWRFLTAPVTAASNSTLSESWQEGAAVTDPAASTSGTNPVPGYGTHISYGYPVANPGYDLNINGNTSIKYVTATGINGIPAATNTGSITDEPAYLLFVRGDRSTQLSLGISAALTSTILRVTGFINTGLVNLDLSHGFKSGYSNFRVIKNPYPAAIDLHKILQRKNSVIDGFPDAFYVWDPNIGGASGVGGWVALSYNSASGRYDKNIASDVDASGVIQSGTAVLIDYDGPAGSIEIQETDKVVSGNMSMFRTMPAINNIRTSLLGRETDGTTNLMDAAMVSFNEYNNNAVDKRDMRKMENFEESFSMMTGNNPLVIERRKPMAPTDTIFYNMKKMKQRNYQLLIEMTLTDVPINKLVYLEDCWLQTKVPVSTGIPTAYDFSIDSSEFSASPGRFRLLFKMAGDSETLQLRHQQYNTVTGGDKDVIHVAPAVVVFPNPVWSNSIRFQMSEAVAGFYTLRLFNAAGEMLKEKVIYHPGGASIQVMDAFSNLVNGNYRLQINGKDKRATVVNVAVQKN